MGNKNFRLLIKENLENIYGAGLEFGIIELNGNEFILTTPFLDNENNLIEIGILIKEPSKIIITDFGKIKNCLFALDELFCSEIKTNFKQDQKYYYDNNKYISSDSSFKSIIPNYNLSNNPKLNLQEKRIFREKQTKYLWLKDFFSNLNITTIAQSSFIGNKSNLNKENIYKNNIYNIECNNKIYKNVDDSYINFTRYEISTNFDSLGIEIKKMLNILQKVYSFAKIFNEIKNKKNNLLEVNDIQYKKEKEKKFNYYLKNIENLKNLESDKIKERDFKKDFIFFLKSLNLNFLENPLINSKSGDKKSFDFVINQKTKKYINIISIDDLIKVKNLIKIYYFDILDVYSFKTSFSIVFDDKKYPMLWYELKKSNIFNLLRNKRIRYFGFFQDYSSLKSYLIK